MTRQTREERGRQIVQNRNALYIELPTLPPTTNNIYINNPRGGRILKAEGRRWKESAILVIRSQAALLDWNAPERTRYALHATFYDTNPDRWDIGNREKLLVDAITEAIHVDDRYCMSMYLEKARGEPRVLVTLRPLGIAEEPASRRKRTTKESSE